MPQRTKKHCNSLPEQTNHPPDRHRHAARLLPVSSCDLLEKKHCIYRYYRFIHLHAVLRICNKTVLYLPSNHPLPLLYHVLENNHNDVRTRRLSTEKSDRKRRRRRTERRGDARLLPVSSCDLLGGSFVHQQRRNHHSYYHYYYFTFVRLSSQRRGD